MTDPSKDLPSRLRDALQLYSAALENSDAHQAILAEAADAIEQLQARIDAAEQMALYASTMIVKDSAADITLDEAIAILRGEREQSND